MRAVEQLRLPTLIDGQELLSGPQQCRCGAMMSYRATSDDDWQWADENGRTTVENHGLPQGYDHPYQLLADLRRQVEEATDHKGPLTRQEAEVAAQYSDLAAALSLLCNPYRHVHEKAPPIEHPELVPECCGEPMRLRPSGWYCRARDECEMPA